MKMLCISNSRSPDKSVTMWGACRGGISHDASWDSAIRLTTSKIDSAQVSICWHVMLGHGCSYCLGCWLNTYPISSIPREPYVPAIEYHHRCGLSESIVWQILGSHYEKSKYIITLIWSNWKTTNRRIRYKGYKLVQSLYSTKQNHTDEKTQLRLTWRLHHADLE